ncbi:hypothetical protein SNEBB_003017 [Seison nebaliae]|nr:hypothetical protein SNEBB_003017 [Seison nebaliae]
MQFLRSCSDEILEHSTKLGREITGRKYTLNPSIDDTFRLLERNVMFSSNEPNVSGNFDDYLLATYSKHLPKNTTCQLNFHNFRVTQLMESNLISILLLIYQHVFVNLQTNLFKLKLHNNFETFLPNFTSVTSITHIIPYVVDEIKSHRNQFMENLHIIPRFNVEQFEASFQLTMDILHLTDIEGKDDHRFIYNRLRLTWFFATPSEIIRHSTHKYRFMDKAGCLAFPMDIPYYYDHAKKNSLNINLNLVWEPSSFKFVKLFFHTSKHMSGLLSNGININAGRETHVKLYVTQVNGNGRHFEDDVFEYNEFYSEQDCYNDKVNNYMIENYNLSSFKNYYFGDHDSVQDFQKQQAFFDSAALYKKFMSIPNEITETFKKICCQKKIIGRYIFTAQTATSSFQIKSIRKFKDKTNRKLRSFYKMKNWSADDIEDVIKNKSYEKDPTIMKKVSSVYGTYEHAQDKVVHIIVTYGDSKISFKKFEKNRNIYGFISDLGGVTGMMNGISIITTFEIFETTLLLLYSWWSTHNLQHKSHNNHILFTIYYIPYIYHL